jgi:hypothetical protein
LHLGNRGFNDGKRSSFRPGNENAAPEDHNAEHHSFHQHENPFPLLGMGPMLARTGQLMASGGNRSRHQKREVVSS